MAIRAQAGKFRSIAELMSQYPSTSKMAKSSLGKRKAVSSNKSVDGDRVRADSPSNSSSDDNIPLKKQKIKDRMENTDAEILASAGDDKGSQHHLAATQSPLVRKPKQDNPQSSLKSQDEL